MKQGGKKRMLEKLLQNEISISYKYFKNLKIDFDGNKITLEDLIRILIKEELECMKKV